MLLLLELLLICVTDVVDIAACFAGDCCCVGDSSALRLFVDVDADSVDIDVGADDESLCLSLLLSLSFLDFFCFLTITRKGGAVVCDESLCLFSLLFSLLDVLSVLFRKDGTNAAKSAER